MIRNFRRTFRKFQYNVASLWGSGSGNHSRFFVCGFIVLGLMAFVSLHAVINIVATTHHYSEVGYFDLYGENLTSCWGGSFVGKSSSAWANTLDRISSWHSSSSSVGSQSIIDNSVRFSTRPVYKVNQSLSGPYPQISAGHCVQFEDPYSYLRPFQKQKVACFPSFMIVGAMKCGTGELMKWLALHPFLQVINGPDNKRESHFFSRGLISNIPNNPRKNEVLRAYAKTLPLLSEPEATQVYTFEKSPDYIRNKAALSLIKTVLPNMRIVIILRNPVYRALSEFHHHCRHRRYVRLLDRVDIIPTNGTEKARWYPKGSILRIVDSDNRDNNHESRRPGKTRLNSLYDIDINDLPLNSYVRLRQPCSVANMEAYFRKNDDNSPNSKRRLITNNSSIFIPSYPEEILNGFFDEQLEKVFKLFHPSQVLVLLQEDMFRNTYRTLRRVESFLGVPCYDYSQVAYTPDPESPPVRKARTVSGKMKEYFRGFLNVFVGAYSEKGVSNTDHHTSSEMHLLHSKGSYGNSHIQSVLPTSTGEKLFQQTSKPFRAWLLSTYAPHNRRLKEILDKAYEWKRASSSISNKNSKTNDSSSVETGTANKYPKQPIIDLTAAHWNLM